MPAERLRTVLQRIQNAADAAGRPVPALLAVSKTQPAAAVAALAAAGQAAFGENYVQEGVEKITALKGSGLDLEWHCIGPIQSNKTQLVAQHFDWAHTLDRA